MAPKKNQPSRLGSDPFGWIRDTREEAEESVEEQAPEAVEAPAAPAPAPARAVTPVPAAQPVKAPQKRPTAQTQAPARAASVPAPRPKPQEEAAPAVQEASPEAVRSAIEEAKEALTVQEIKALAALLEEAKGPAKRGRPRTNFREVTKSSQEGLPENWTRATFIVRETHLETLKDYAYTQRMTIRDALDQALEQYLEDKQVIARRVRGEEE